MKKGNKFAKSFQTVLGVGIIAFSGVFGFMEYRHLNRHQELLASEKAQFETIRDVCLDLQTTLPQHELALRHFANALTPLQISVDTIVNLRDYTIMDKHPLYVLGNAFTGLQQSIQEVQNSLVAGQDSFRKAGMMQMKIMIPAAEKCISYIDQEMTQPEFFFSDTEISLFSRLVIFILAGLGFILNGINHPNPEKAVKVVPQAVSPKPESQFPAVDVIPEPFPED